MISAQFPAAEHFALPIAVPPDGTCACRIHARERPVSATGSDERSIERVWTERLA